MPDLYLDTYTDLYGQPFAPNPVIYDAGIAATLNGFGAALNGGFLELYSGSQPAVDGALTGTLLVKLPLSATAFAAATVSGFLGTMVANAIANTNPLANGVVGYFALVESDGVTVVATGTVDVTNADLVLSYLTTNLGVPWQISSFVVTQAQNH